MNTTKENRGLLGRMAVVVLLMCGLVALPVTDRPTLGGTPESYQVHDVGGSVRVPAGSEVGRAITAHEEQINSAPQDQAAARGNVVNAATKPIKVTLSPGYYRTLYPGQSGIFDTFGPFDFQKLLYYHYGTGQYYYAYTITITPVAGVKVVGVYAR